MKVLGIESSCDETAAAVVEGGRKVAGQEPDGQKHAVEQLSGLADEGLT